MAADQAQETENGSSPAQDFAALMSSAAAVAAPAPEDAPYGYTIDRETGERRAKKTAGRPRKSPTLDELRAARAEAQPAGPAASEQAGDVAPDSRRRRRHKHPHEPGEDRPGVKDGPGVITKGVNRLYRRAGKIVKAMDADIGTAIIEATRNTADKGEPDDSVGAAWEEVCKTNPRIRAFVLRCLAGGAWSQLVFAHAPILLAILLKDGIRKRLPFAKFLEAFLEDEADQDQGDTGPKGGLAGLMDGLGPDDLQQMTQLAQSLMGGMAARSAAA